MTRTGFESALHRSEQSTRELGQLVVDAISQAMTALRTLDRQLAERVIRNDATINAKRYAIEEETVGIIATQQPVARDLRFLVSILYIIVDLERMADHAEGIARIVTMHGDRPLVKPLIDLPRMAEIATSMLRDSLGAFFARDMEAAKRVADRDDEVDALTDQVYRELLTYMFQDPSTIDRATYLIWAAHNLERIADRATNICERALYLVPGGTQEINVSRY
jgi:phosphate transport system protein